ncbi:MAG: light-harvesting protein [Pseudomonadota bacterium]
MNNSKIWLVVKPTVGVPLFLGAVAVGSFAVHVAVLTNTSWVSDFLSGNELGAGDQSAALTIEGTDGITKAAFVKEDGTLGDGKILVEMPDGTLAVATMDAPAVLASASQSRLPPGD